jgi:hypothetical protein
MPGIGMSAPVVALLVMLTSIPAGGQRIDALLTGQMDENSNPLLKWFREEPLINARSVPTRPGGLTLEQDIIRFVRIYFPRTYPEIRDFHFIMLHSPVLTYLGDKQERWMHDAIRLGTGGLSAPSCFSVQSDIHDPWIASVLNQAFPNDCSSVISAGGPGGQEVFKVIVNREFPEPVLTPFLPLGIESFVGTHAFMIIPREGSTTLAWQVGGFPTRVPYMSTWTYENGRTLTLGDSFGMAFWSSYFGRASTNPYSLDILMNIVLYLTKREVPTDVLVFHRMRGTFMEFRTRMGLLMSLADFAQKFGANDERLQMMVADLEGQYSQATNEYLSQDFVASEETMIAALENYAEYEQVIVRLKEQALLWVYMAEWMVTTATLMISSFVLWTVMVRRRLYREVTVTKLGDRGTQQ